MTHILEDNLDVNHLSEDQTDTLILWYKRQFEKFPIHTKEGDKDRLEKIYDDIYDQGGMKTATWEQDREIEEEFGTTYVCLCMN